MTTDESRDSASSPIARKKKKEKIQKRQTTRFDPRNYFLVLRAKRDHVAFSRPIERYRETWKSVDSTILCFF